MPVALGKRDPMVPSEKSVESGVSKEGARVEDAQGVEPSGISSPLCKDGGKEIQNFKSKGAKTPENGNGHNEEGEARNVEDEAGVEIEVIRSDLNMPAAVSGMFGLRFVKFVARGSKTLVLWL
ncbi:hypothetical protein U1Q18_009955 [Sarracenia purpurea var. burkii]